MMYLSTGEILEQEYCKRQETEVTAIKSIYSATGEFEDLRLTDALQTSRPPEIALRLQSAPGDDQVRRALRLLLKMSARYPDSPPDLQLQEQQQLSDAQLARMQAELERLASEKLGSEMVLELASRCQELLDSPIKSRSASPHAKEHHEHLEIKEALSRSQERQSSGTAQSEGTDSPSDLPEDGVPSNHLANDFKTLKLLGSGKFGTVVKVQYILDKKLYAVKKISLKENSPQDYAKIVNEAQYLARLQHKNIVQYYTCWKESEDIEDKDNEDKDAEDDDDYDSEVGYDSSKEQNLGEGDVSSDSIAFECLPRVRTRLFLCIQMEYCEKSTLKMALESGVHKDQQRLSRLFREIVEGLSHVHGHRLIHHDLKPDNIFLDHNDHAKIGDFGLAIFKVHKPLSEDAVTDRASIEAAGAMPSSSDAGSPSYSRCVVTLEEGVTCPKYPIGTPFYCAPELNPELAPGKGDHRRFYTEKVDIYSLGVILFEMCFGKLNTRSEAIRYINNLRQSETPVEEILRQRLTDRQLQLLRWMLHHEPNKRPSCEQLLSSGLVPPPPLEEALRREMVEACFSQSLPEVRACKVQLDEGDVAPKSAVLASAARRRLEQVFQRHGAVPLSAPLLSVADEPPADDAVRLLTSTGTLVELPRSLRRSLARMLARDGVTTLRYYAMERVYEERRPRGQPPCERQEVLFGWHAAPGGALLADAELLALLGEVLAAFPALASRDHHLVLGHTSLLEAALQTSGVPPDSHEAVVELLCQQERDSPRSQLHRDLGSLGLSKKCLSQLLRMLDLRGSLERVQQQFTRRRHSEAARQALRELATVTEFAQELGVTCQMVVHPGLVLAEEHRHFRGPLFQLQCRRRRGPSVSVDVLAEGGRHDPLLSRYWSLLAPRGVPPPAAAAVSIVFDALTEAVAEEGGTVSRPFEVVVADGGDREATRRQAGIARQLRTAGVRVFLFCGADSPEAADEAARWAALHGARVLLLPKASDARMVRVRRLEAPRSAERAVPADDLVSHLEKLGVSG